MTFVHWDLRRDQHRNRHYFGTAHLYDIWVELYFMFRNLAANSLFSPPAATGCLCIIDLERNGLDQTIRTSVAYNLEDLFRTLVRIYMALILIYKKVAVQIDHVSFYP